MLKQFFLFFLISQSASIQIDDVFRKFDKLLDFIDLNYYEMNIDALIGITLAQANLIVAKSDTVDLQLQEKIDEYILRCSSIIENILTVIPRTTDRMRLIEDNLLDTIQWTEIIQPFNFGKIKDLGIYQNWTSLDIKKNRRASFMGIPTDLCVLDILEQKKCYINAFCKLMMFQNRVDAGYLLTHRLLYTQILRLKKCLPPIKTLTYWTRKFCSLIYKEMKTSAMLDYPYHDIFLEQSLLCGIEGHAEMISTTFLKEILSWQEPSGCYKSFPDDFSKRTSNIIQDGCSDHSTGLATGVLSMYIRFLSQ